MAWFAADQAWASSFDQSHRSFGTVLQRFVKGDLVDYSALKTYPRDLNEYLDQLGAVPEKDFMAFSEKQKIAFLINLYNAATLRLIIDHYPLGSIKDIGNWLNGPFDQKVVRLMGKTFSLGDVEHAILRKNHNEPRVHFALVCASLGCPPLQTEPYVAEKLDIQLDDQARKFLATAPKNSVDVKTRTLYLSKIFKWYEKDFARKDRSVISFILPYLPGDAALAVKTGGFKIAYTDYDWSLNDLAAGPKGKSNAP